MIEGQISNIVDFGAFVDLDGIDGLIHISELSWSHVNHPSEILSIGDTVQVKVLDIDRDRQRISLGLKQTQEDPWQRVVDTYNVGDELEGKVTKVVAFGAFVEILEGVEGLVHISELAQHHVENPREIIQPGDDVKVKILEIDSERRRLSLSIKRVEGQVLPQRDTMAPEETPDGGPVDLDNVPELGLSEDVFAATPGDEPAAEAERSRRGAGSRRARRRRGSAGSPRARPPSTRPKSPLASPAFVGLTGGIGAGKSEALAALERLGAAVLSTDAVVHELYASAEVRDAVVERWGPEVAPEGVTDRRAVAQRAFATPEDREWLEGLLWPRVGERIVGVAPGAVGARAAAARARRRGPAAVRIGDGRGVRRYRGSGGRRGRQARARRGEGARGARRAHVAPAHPGGESGPSDVHGRKLRDARGPGAGADRGT